MDSQITKRKNYIRNSNYKTELSGGCGLSMNISKKSDNQMIWWLEATNVRYYILTPVKSTLGSFPLQLHLLPFPSLKTIELPIVLEPVIFRHPSVPLDRLFLLPRIPYPSLSTIFSLYFPSSSSSTKTSVFPFCLLGTGFGISLTAWTIFISY